jgi:succinyl-diaminopimelate desuccinylase
MIDPINLSKDLMKFRSISPNSSGSLEFLSKILSEHKFKCNLLEFGENKVKNLYAIYKGGNGPNICFAGHTDVVPPGDENDWDSDPFQPVIKNGKIFGRGASDMKTAIAAYISSVLLFLSNNNNSFNGSISFLLTADEEGDADFGTKKVIEWLKSKKNKPDFCIVGEPTNPSKIGEMIKIGRRGSLNGIITINGKQGHVAYPEKAKNPIDDLISICKELQKPLDSGSKAFQPSNLVVTSVDVGNNVTNLIPQRASIRFNIRFNDNFNSKQLVKLIKERISKKKVDFKLDYKVSGESFFNYSEKLTEALTKSIKKVTKIKTELSTSGGTSDARFISKICPVIEFGMIGKTMHQVNEYSRIDDIKELTKIYKFFLDNIFKDKY